MTDYDWWFRGFLCGTATGAAFMVLWRLVLDLAWAAYVWWSDRRG